MTATVPLAAVPAAGPRPRSPGRAALVTSRPDQWIKNGLLFAGPLAAGVLAEPATLLRVGVGCLAFTGAAVGAYFVNDAQDVLADRVHPIKRLRPIASGELGVRSARVIGVAAFLVAGGLGAVLGITFLAVLSVYLLLTVAYSLCLKHVPVLDITCVASGFLLRALAGCAAAGVLVSNWFLLVCFFGSLLVVTGKRHAELLASGSDAVRSRAALAAYPEAWLGQIHLLALTATVMSYSLWAVQDLGSDTYPPALALSVLPFTVALLRYSLLVAQGNGERPERLLVHDTFVRTALAVCGVLLVVGIYAA